MKTIIIESIGYIGVILNTISTLPQLIKTYKTKDVNGLSFSFIFCWAIGCACMTCYAVLTTSTIPTIINYGLNVVFPLILLTMYYRYKK